MLTGIIHIGMGDHALAEARALNVANRGEGGAFSIRQKGDTQDVLTLDGTRFDLRGEAGWLAFAASLELASEGTATAARLLGQANSGAKDELAQVMNVYKQAEQGARDMKRVVLSGHSVGSQIWGDHNGLLHFSLLEELATLFPTAAGQVRHLMLSACYTGGERGMTRYRRMFPGLQSIWAYAGSSPGTWSGAIPHLERWEAATDSGDGSAVAPRLAAGTRKGEFVATWNHVHGYLGDEPMPLWELEQHLAAQDGLFQRYLTGEEPVTDSQTGPLRDYYGLVQRALSQPDLPNGRVTELEQRRDQTIRLLYWDTIRERFADGYSAVLSAGYAKRGEQAFHFAGATRAAALAEARRLEADGADQELLALVSGLASLDNDVVLTRWV